MVLGSSPVAVTSASDFAPVWRKEFLDIQSNIESVCRMRHVHDMTRTCSQMHRTDKYSEYSTIIGPVWPNGSVFV